MISHDPTVPGNLLKIARDVRKLGSAPLGPVSVGPGQGSVRFFDSSGDQFQILPSGAWVRFRGGMQSVQARFENDAAAIEGHTATLGLHDGRITVNKNRNDAQDGILDGHNTRITVNKNRNDAQDGILDGHNTRIGTAQGRADSAWTRAGTGISNAATAQSRADSAYSRAGTGISNAATAQSRADAAYALASGSAGSADIQRLEDLIDNLRGRIQDLENWRNSLPQG